MKSATLGRSTSPAEVTNVSVHGFWLFVHEREVFLSFKDFPWFKDATVRKITNVQLPSPHHLYWPDLDIDLAVESIEHPEKYPLVSQAQPNNNYQASPRQADRSLPSGRRPKPKKRASKRRR